MPHIHVLPKEVAEKIAAGEVVERPASAVKELLENALDAGASAVTLEIQNGGVRFIRVADNGGGIPADEVDTAFLRHATSKVQKDADLEAIGTLGFRGEALASIAAVSKVELITRTADALEGARIALEGGEVTERAPAGCPVGTTVLVRDLFYNTPARMKFLKKDASEATAVRAVAERLALSHPEVSFKFIKDGREELHTPGDSRLLSAVHAVLGRDFARALLPVDYTLNGIRVSGFVTRPVDARANRSMQFFFINGRLVQSRTAIAALEQSCRGSVMVGRFPGAVLHVELPAALVDVNVHPAKTEVRFADEHAVFDAVYYAVKNAVAEKDPRPSLSLPEAPKSLPFAPRPASQLHFESERTEDTGVLHAGASTVYLPSRPAVLPPAPQEGGAFSVGSPSAGLPAARLPAAGADNAAVPPAGQQAPTFPMPETDETAAAQAAAPQTPGTVPAAPQDGSAAQAAAFAAPVVTEGAETSAVGYEAQASAVGISAKAAPVPFRVVGQCFGTYLIVEQGDTLYLIDKHAAHERLLYEDLKKDEQSVSQLLLAPRAVTLAREEHEALVGHLDVVRRAGFEVDDFGGATVLVRAAPLWLREEDIVPAVEELAGKLAGFGKDLTPARIDELWHSVACRAAIKAGDVTGGEEAARLAERVLALDDVRYCPHGRPVAFVLTRAELEKQFGRV